VPSDGGGSPLPARSQPLFHLVSPQRPGQSNATVGEHLDAGALLGELVADLTEELPQHVFDADDPLHAAVLVDDDGLRAALLLEEANEAMRMERLGNERDRAQQLLDRR
jgi:hypothetical protein